MNYQKFKEHFAQDVQKLLVKNGIEDMKVSCQYMEKVNNESYDALLVQHVEGTIGTNFNLRNYYRSIEEGASYENVVKVAAVDAVKSVLEVPVFDMDMIKDYEQAKKRLSIEVISAEKNADILAKVPHKTLEDMAIVYRINVDLEGQDRGTVLVNKGLLDVYGITPEQLHKDAIRNAAIIKPMVISDMNKMIGALMEAEEIDYWDSEDMSPDGYLYVATVSDNHKGAGVLAYDHFFDYATQIMGGDFYVIPSSIHEIILVKDDGHTDYRELEQMVKTINATEVRPEDRLTDSVYHYDSKNKIFELGKKYARRRLQEKFVEREEKQSVLNELKEKQASIKISVGPKGEVSFKDRGGEAL